MIERGRILKIVVAGLWLFALGRSRALAVDVQAKLSSGETLVGRPVMFEIMVQDAKDAEISPIPEVPGATIRSAGSPSQRIFMQSDSSGRMVQNVTLSYRYQIIPQREGKLTIP